MRTRSSPWGWAATFKKIFPFETVEGCGSKQRTFLKTLKIKEMGYVNVNVDINLDDIDTDDLIDEFCIRLERKGRVNDDEKQQLREALGTPTFENIEIKTLDDTMKYDHLSKVFTKYTLTQIETLLP